MPLPWWQRAFWPHHVLRLKAGTRAAFIGRPDAGKTTFQKWLLEPVPSVLVYDTKPDPGWQEDASYQQLQHPADLAGHARSVLRVSIEWLRDAAGWKDPQAGIGWLWTHALNEPMRRGATVVLFDEALYSLPATGGNDAAHRLFQQGRSFGVTVLVGTQLGNCMDTRVLRTAEHLFCFRMIHQTDLDEVARARGVETSTLQVLRPREIAYHHESEHCWHVFRPVKFGRRHLRRRRNIPPPTIAAAPSRTKAWWYVRRWIRRCRLPLFLWCLFGGALPFLGWRALAFLALLLYVLVRRWRGDRWSVDVECWPHKVSTEPAPAPLALPAHEEPWRLKIPGRRAS